MLNLDSAIIISLGVFLLGHKRYVKVPPQSSAIVDAVKTVAIACREKGFQNAKPSVLSNVVGNGKYKIAREARYTDAYVEDVRRGVKSCKVSYHISRTIVTHALTRSHQIFLFFPFYFICWIQIWNNLISQAGEMALHGTPNDLLQNLDPIALIIFIPFLDCKFAPIRTPRSRLLAVNMLHYWSSTPAYAS